MKVLSNSLFTALILSYSQLAFADGSNDEIKAMLSRTFDKPNNPVVAEVVVIDRNYAMADWMQGNKGGRTLLVKDATSWKVLLCGGDTLLNINNVKSARVPQKTAQSLISQLINNEKNISEEKLKIINAFRGEKH